MLCDSAINNNNGVRVTVTRAAMSWGDEILLSSYVWNSMSSRWSISLATMEADIWEPIINDCRSEFGQFYANVVGFLNTYYRKHETRNNNHVTKQNSTRVWWGVKLYSNHVPTNHVRQVTGKRNNNHVTIRYDTRCYFNVRSKADMSRFNLPHEDDN